MNEYFKYLAYISGRSDGLAGRANCCPKRYEPEKSSYELGYKRGRLARDNRLADSDKSHATSQGI